MERTEAEILRSYSSDGSVNYVLLVTQTATSEADAALYEKNGDGWTLTGKFAVFIGRNGIGKTCEGDGRTPSGQMRAVSAFGLQPNPGTALDYIDINPYIYACDAEGPFYNRIVDVRETGCACSGEHMCEYSPQYDYGLVTDYNKENVYPLGSAIFIHCKGSKRSTSGCISLDRDDMIALLRVADKGLVIFVR